MSTRIAPLVAVVAFFASVLGASAEPPTAAITLVPSVHSGWGVDGTTGGNICSVASKDECRTGRRSRGPGGFRYITSVAVDPSSGDVYTSENGTSRVQELTASGRFVAMFGWGVNKTKDRQAGASRAEKNICTAASGDVCGAGTRGPAPGQLTYPASLAVALGGGYVYVVEIGVGDFRVDKYTADGRFVWMAGKHVNATTGANLCSEREIERAHVRCGAGAENQSASLEPAAFKFSKTEGDLLAAGGPEGLLYVGDEHRVQELGADGRWRREILLASLSSQPESHVAALALDGAGDLYLVYRVPALASAPGGEQRDLIHEFNASGEPVGEFAVLPKQAGASVRINGLAIDPAGMLAAIGYEAGEVPLTRLGTLYDARTRRRVSGYATPSDNDGIAFNGNGDLYFAATDEQEVAAYVPAPAVELVSSPVACGIAPPGDGAAAFECALATGWKHL
jgi:hypothetical protein